MILLRILKISNKNIKEVININELLKVKLINNRTNKSITPCLIMESNKEL